MMPILSGSELTAQATPDCLLKYSHDLILYTRSMCFVEQQEYIRCSKVDADSKKYIFLIIFFVWKYRSGGLVY